jgi:hypothetical protein
VQMKVTEMEEMNKPRSINTCKQTNGAVLTTSSILNGLCYNLSISHRFKDLFHAKSFTQRIPGYQI